MNKICNGCRKEFAFDHKSWKTGQRRGSDMGQKKEIGALGKLAAYIIAINKAKINYQEEAKYIASWLRDKGIDHVRFSKDGMDVYYPNGEHELFESSFAAELAKCTWPVKNKLETRPPVRVS